MKIREVAQSQMENLVKADNFIVAFAGAMLSPIFHALYGEKGTQMMVFVIGLLLLDLIVGTMAAKKEKIETSEHGLKGLIRIGVLSCVPIFGHQADVFIGMGDMMFFGLALGILYHSMKSFGANLVRVGWDKYLPMWMLDLLVRIIETELQSKKARSMAQFEKLYPGVGGQPLAPTFSNVGNKPESEKPVSESLAIDIEVKG